MIVDKLKALVFALMVAGGSQNVKQIALLQAVELKQAKQFFEQGIATKNDALRFQIQQANILLAKIEIKNNRKIINYHLDILPSLPEYAQLKINPVWKPINKIQPLTAYLNLAYANCQEFKQTDNRNKATAGNDRLLTSTYKNNIATTTKFIEAEINL